MKELNGPNGNFSGCVKGREEGLECGIVSLNLSNALIIFDSERMRKRERTCFFFFFFGLCWNETKVQARLDVCVVLVLNAVWEKYGGG